MSLWVMRLMTPLAGSIPPSNSTTNSVPEACTGLQANQFELEPVQFLEVEPPKIGHRCWILPRPFLGEILEFHLQFFIEAVENILVNAGKKSILIVHVEKLCEEGGDTTKRQPRSRGFAEAINPWRNVSSTGVFDTSPPCPVILAGR
ncbi:MAG: hypothetical protein R3F31_14180 [Verrucomicrobiales bacterium]